MVYITSSLFGPEHDHASPSTSRRTHDWNDTQGALYDTALGKRKRRLDRDGGDQSPKSHDVRPNMHNYVLSESNHGFRQNSSIPFDSPLSHPVHLQGLDAGSSTAFTISPKHTHHRWTETRPVKQARRQIHARKRIHLTKQPSHLMDIEVDHSHSQEPNLHNTANNNAYATTPPIDLRPCHICHKAPKRKSDLDGYLRCSGCTKQACYICARNCTGCDQRLCSGCCVELGEEGDAFCLNCYQQDTIM